MSDRDQNEGIDYNEEFAMAMALIEHQNANVFITGKAGTGKSTFLELLQSKTKKNTVVLAPTGVAAVHVKGQTIHAFFKFRPGITVDKVSSIKFNADDKRLIKKLDTIIIDEVSMVRADLVDCMDKALRLHGNDPQSAFGGIQMVFIGDLFQLAPVVLRDERLIFEDYYKSPYFFDAKVFDSFKMELIEFDINYRQKDQSFLELLNSIRNKTITQNSLDIINDRCDASFMGHDSEMFVYLTTTNRLADSLNQEKLASLKTEVYTAEAVIRGKVDKKYYPTHDELNIKIGAQVMLLNNDAEGRWVNGSIGQVEEILSATFTSRAVIVRLMDGTQVEVEPHTWDIYSFEYDEKKDRIESQVEGTFTQFPIKLAWAVTIHKSQGKTFDNVIIDIGQGSFCHGQIYVALSRCRTLEGIVLKKPIRVIDIKLDSRILRYVTDGQYDRAERTLPLEEKMKILEAAIDQETMVEIVYLKENNQKNKRIIEPKLIRKLDYKGSPCVGVEAFCLARQSNWIFRVSCILSAKILKEQEIAKI